MKKRTITLTFDCYVGPIVGVAVDESGREITEIAVIDDDAETQKIVDEARALWFSLFKNVDFSEENPAGFEFDEKRERGVAPELMALTEKLIRRLDEINDGSFQIEDWATPKFKRSSPLGNSSANVKTPSPWELGAWRFLFASDGYFLPYTRPSISVASRNPGLVVAKGRLGDANRTGELRPRHLRVLPCLGEPAPHTRRSCPRV